jgi:hypothetical protein
MTTSPRKVFQKNEKKEVSGESDRKGSLLQYSAILMASQINRVQGSFFSPLWANLSHSFL